MFDAKGEPASTCGMAATQRRQRKKGKTEKKITQNKGENPSSWGKRGTEETCGKKT